MQINGCPWIYTDAVSFALMKRLKIKKAFSFDKHFMISGFANIP
jgi:predicted nucleic acid-binding protein